MAEKFVMDEKGIVVYSTTSNFQLEKPLVSDNYDINVHNRNMDKIDTAINEVKGQVDGLELTSTKVIRPNGKNVEESLSANETSISSLETKVSNSQNHKVTSDNGKCINKGSKDANELILNGHYDGSNMVNMPNNSSDWWYIDVNAHSNGNYVYQEATELNKDPARKYYRTMQSGTWKPWRSL